MKKIFKTIWKSFLLLVFLCLAAYCSWVVWGIITQTKTGIVCTLTSVFLYFVMFAVIGFLFVREPLKKTFVAMRHAFAFFF
jgi:hypothetical protein